MPIHRKNELVVVGAVCPKNTLDVVASIRDAESLGQAFGVAPGRRSVRVRVGIEITRGAIVFVNQLAGVVQEIHEYVVVVIQDRQGGTFAHAREVLSESSQDFNILFFACLVKDDRRAVLGGRNERSPSGLADSRCDAVRVCSPYGDVRVEASHALTLPGI